METEPQGTEPTTPEPQQDAPVLGDDDNTLAMLTHLSGIILGFIVPLIVWLMNKGKAGKEFLEDQSKEALNFQITILIAYVAAVILGRIPGLGILTWAVWIVNIVFCIMAGMATNKGERYRYPFALRLIS